MAMAINLGQMMRLYDVKCKDEAKLPTDIDVASLCYKCMGRDWKLRWYAQRTYGANNNCN